MAKQSVMEMLKKPVQRPAQSEPQRGGLSSIMEAELHDMAMERINKKALDAAMAEFGPKLADAEGRATKFEAEFSQTKAALAAIQAKHKEMEAMHQAEKSAKEAANKACDEECEKTRNLESQVGQLTARLAEIERHNASLQGNLTAVTAEVGKRVQEQVNATVIPGFDFEVTSRGLKGEIKTVSIKPKK